MKIRWESAEFCESFGRAEQLKPSKGPEIAFSGRSNVGKSSLINKIFNRKSLARVSSVPGKTVTVNFFKADSVWFADLPGYGYAKRSDAERRRWASLMETYFRSGRDIRLTVQLLDLRHPPTADDRTMLEFLLAQNIPFVLALTKADKTGPTAKAQRLHQLESELAFVPASIPRIPVSSKTGEGIEALKAAVEQALD